MTMRKQRTGWKQSLKRWRIRIKRLYYYVTTDNQKYFFLIKEYPVDTDHPENVGFYLLLIVHEEDRLNIYDGEQKILFDGKIEYRAPDYMRCVY